jgi:hypothetical protein
MGGGGGGSMICHTYFFHFLKTLLEVKSYVWQQYLAFKDTLIFIWFVVQSKLGLIIGDQIQKNVTLGGGGVRKVPKSVSEWPLIDLWDNL